MSIRQDIMREDVATLAEIEGKCRELNAALAASCRIQASGAVDTAYDIAQKKLELARCEKILNITVEELKRLLVPDRSTPWTMFVCEVLNYSIFVTDEGSLFFLDGCPEKHPGEAATAEEYPKLQPLCELPQRWRERVIFYIRRSARHAAVRKLLQGAI